MTPSVTRAEPSILHVDLDAFYASVEQLHDPALRGRPVVVGGTGHRGVVCAASYEARAFGVHSAMPTARARRLCPHAVFLPPRFDAYGAASRDVHAVFATFTPVIEPIALDEAFLDVAGAQALFGPPESVACELRVRVRDATGLTVSVGAATTKLVAKLASDSAKPDGMLVIAPGTELEFLHPLPVQRLWGVGPATFGRLERFGVATVGDLAALPEDTLVAALGGSAGRHLHALAWNRDERAVETDRDTKSVGQEETFARDLTERADLHREVTRLADRVGTRLREHGLRGRTVTLKVRYFDFTTITRSATLPEPTDASAAIVQVVTALLEKVDSRGGVRLLGVSVKNFVTGASQQDALPFADERDRAAGADLERTIDAIRKRYGDRAVGTAALLDADP
jgi:DNA polymerase-4